VNRTLYYWFGRLDKKKEGDKKKRIELLCESYPLLVGLTFILNSWNCLETKITKQKDSKKKDTNTNKPNVARSTWKFFLKLNRGRIRELNAHLGFRGVEKICGEEFAALNLIRRGC
jgi:hypothetical protein